MQGGTCGTENCDGRGLMYSAWPITVGWVAGSGWMPIWLTNADQLRFAHAEPGSQSNQPQSARVTCGSSVKSVFWIWSLRPGCSKVSWDLWNGTIDQELSPWECWSVQFSPMSSLSSWQRRLRHNIVPIVIAAITVPNLNTNTQTPPTKQRN